MRLKDMKLTFSRDENTWSKTITDLNTGALIFEMKGIKLFPDMLNKQYFDDWEKQLRSNPNFNIIEVERFI